MSVKEKAIELFQQGMAVPQIAKQLNAPRTTVLYHVRKFQGLIRRPLSMFEQQGQANVEKLVSSMMTELSARNLKEIGTVSLVKTLEILLKIRKELTTVPDADKARYEEAMERLFTKAVKRRFPDKEEPEVLETSAKIKEVDSA